jgi:hypothetical protein
VRTPAQEIISSLELLALILADHSMSLQFREERVRYLKKAIQRDSVVPEAAAPFLILGSCMQAELPNLLPTRGLVLQPHADVLVFVFAHALGEQGFSNLSKSAWSPATSLASIIEVFTCMCRWQP